MRGVVVLCTTASKEPAGAQVWVRRTRIKRTMVWMLRCFLVRRAALLGREEVWVYEG